MKRQQTGNLGERLACDFLQKKGYRILETNYRCRFGEIDIVALTKGCLVFIEVRTKSNSGFGSPEESITETKILHLERSAEYYRQQHPGMPESWRVDLVAIEIDSQQKVKRIELIENPFEAGS